MKKNIRTAIFPVAGLGTRFLPITKVMPKEMLPIVDKPLIQYAIEEAKEAGIEEFILVTGKGKSIIEDHFDDAFELGTSLSKGRKINELRDVEGSTIGSGKLFYTRQVKPLGLGHAIWCARRFVREQPFVVIAPDDLVLSTRGCLSQMMDVYDEVGGNLVAVENVPKNQTHNYGILDVTSDNGKIVGAKALIEKPLPAEAPSTLSIIGRYILHPEVFTCLDSHEVGKGGEIQLTDAIAKTMDRVPFHGFRFKGERFDCGSKVGFLAANIAYALKRNDLGGNVREILKEKYNLG